MGLIFMIGASALDSEGTNIPLLMVVVSMVWLTLFAISNGYLELER